MFCNMCCTTLPCERRRDVCCFRLARRAAVHSLRSRPLAVGVRIPQANGAGCASLECDAANGVRPRRSAAHPAPAQGASRLYTGRFFRAALRRAHVFCSQRRFSALGCFRLGRAAQAGRGSGNVSGHAAGTNAPFGGRSPFIRVCRSQSNPIVTQLNSGGRLAPLARWRAT
jgi:hypothetical protein